LTWIGTNLAFIARGDQLSIPIVIDTEIGDNIDDAFALALALSSPEIELLGVTTTFYHAQARSLLARRLLGAYGRCQIPVNHGQSHLFQGEPPADFDTFTQMEEAVLKEPMSISTNMSALDWLGELTKTEQNITYIANGPLTNLADFIHHYPTQTKALKQIVLMGGWATQRLPEWNISHDPRAAAIVFESEIPIVVIGREVTLGCILTQSQVEMLLESNLPGTKFLMTLYRQWAKTMGNTPPIMYDPLTVMYLCDPSLVQLEYVPLRVQTEPGPTYGVLYQDPTGVPVHMATDVDRGRYLNTLVSRLTGQTGIRELYPAKLQVDIKDALEITYPLNWQMKRNVTAKHILACVIQGEGTVENSDGLSTTMQEGDLVYIPPHCVHQMSTRTGMTMSILYFDCWQTRNGEQEDYLLPLTNQNLVHQLPDPTYGKSTIAQIVDLWSKPSLKNMLICQSRLLSVVAYLCNTSQSPSETANETKQLVKEIREYLEEKAEESIVLEQLEIHFSLSKYHLIRIFKQETNMTPMQYHRLLKMRRARTLLELDHISIKQIAHRLGYSSIQAFSRAFKQETGMSPRAYQQLSSR